MASEPIHTPSRRALLATAAGGVAAAVAGSLGRPEPAAAATGGNAKLGYVNNAETRTDIRNTTGGTAIAGLASGSGSGIFGSSPSGDGVFGYSVSGRGIFGSSSSGRAVQGSSGAGIGVYGNSSAGHGVHGESDSSSLPAVYGQANGNSTAVLGYSGTTRPPTSPSRTGVLGYANQGAGSVGVQGTSPAGRGGLFKGGAAQLRLSPSSANTHPGTGQKGDLFVDKHGRLWFCKGGNTWKQLA